MRFSQLSFVFRRVAKSFREVLWSHVLTSGTMAMALLIFGGFLLVQENLEGLLRGWGSRVQIFAYVENNFAATAVEPLLSRLRNYPEVESARFISQREAWDNFKKSLGAQSGVLDGLSADTLPASLEIALKPGYGDHDALAGVAARMRAEPGITEVEYPQQWMEKFSVVVLALRWAKWLLGGFLFLATLLIVGNTVKLAIFARREEIEIMQLVGAPSAVIRMPFVIEGMIQGCAGAALSLLLLGLLFLALQSQLPLTEILIDRGQLKFLAPESAALLLALGVAMGAFGSFLSLGRFLPKW